MEDLDQTHLTLERKKKGTSLAASLHGGQTLWERKQEKKKRKKEKEKKKKKKMKKKEKEKITA